MGGEKFRTDYTIGAEKGGENGGEKGGETNGHLRSAAAMQQIPCKKYFVVTNNL